MKKITVKAGPGLVVFFPRRVIAAPGAKTLTIRGDETAEVSGADRFVVKRLQCGDLIMVKQTRQAKPAEAKVEKKKPAKRKSEDK